MRGLDWAVVGLYGAAVLAIGWVANRRQRLTEDYLLGGRRLRWWAVGVSLIATSFSSLALVGATGFGFRHGVGWLQLQVGDLLAVLVAITVLLPFYARLRLTSAYEYLEARFGPVARSVASLLFLGQTLLRTALLVLAPALALTAVTDLSVEEAVLASGAAAILYATAGGISAVVWTDLVQMGIVVVGVGASLVLVAGDVPGGLGALWAHAGAHGRLDAVRVDFDLSGVMSLPGAVLAYGTLALAIAGTNQQAVQRYMACRSLGDARRAALLGWAIGFVAIAATLLLGVTLFAWSELAPGGEVLRDAGDEALPRFIASRLPAGLAGLMVAGIFAASMSSMDSAIHSMSTATLVDFFRRFGRARTDREETRLARVLTALFGVLATGAALLAARGEPALLDTLVRWLGWFAGPLLGLFLLGMLTRGANERGALLGVLAGAALVVTLEILRGVHAWPVHPLWFAPAACLLTIGAGRLLSTGSSGPSRRAPMDGGDPAPPPP